MPIHLSRTFVLRKLHQLTGIVPLGAFLLEHFYTNSKALMGAVNFNTAVADLQSVPYVLAIEITVIFIPLIYPRGAHYKPEFPNRDDANWLRTTIAEHSGEGPVISYEPVDVSLIKPRRRDYAHAKRETAKI